MGQKIRIKLGYKTLGTTVNYIQMSTLSELKTDLTLTLGEEELLIKDPKMREVLVNPLTGRVWQEGDVYTRFYYFFLN